MNDNRVVFCSDDFAGNLDNKARIALWHDIYTANYGETDIDWRGGGEFRARSEFLPFGDAVVGHIDYMFHRVARTRRHISRDNQENLIIGFMRDAPVRGRLGHREVDAPAGSIFFYSTARPVEFRNELGLITGNTLVLPHHTLAGAAKNLDDRVGRLLDPSDPAVCLLARYVEFLMASPPGIASAPLNDHIRHTLVDLAAIAVGAGQRVALEASQHASPAVTGGRERSLASARLALVKKDILARLRQPDLTIEAIARHQGISPRYVRKLFAMEGSSFTKYLGNSRLDLAASLLQSADHCAWTVADIALEVGFNDISWFNRAFRQRLGTTPSEVRAEAIHRI